MKKQGIYMILNTSNMKVYIGSSRDLSRRKREHFYLLRKNLHKNTHLQFAFNKYGESLFHFIILEIVEDLSLLISKEQEYILSRDSENQEKGYNKSMPELNGSTTLQEHSIEKLRRVRHKKIYGEVSEEDYQNWKTEKEIKDSKPKRDTRIILLDRKTLEEKYEFSGPTEACKVLSLRIKRLQECLAGSRKSYAGYIFKYKISR